MQGLHIVRRVTGAALGVAAFALAMLRLLSTESGDAERLFCICLALALAVFLVGATRRIGVGFLAAGTVVGSVWLANRLKLSYLNEPLLAPDLSYFLTGSTVDVVMHYPGIWQKLVLAVFGGLLLATLVWRWESPSLLLRRRPGLRIAVAAFALLPLLLVASPQGPFQHIHTISPWHFIENAQHNPVTAFVRSFARMDVSVPSYRLADAAREDWGHASPVDAGTRRPDIVAVLEESTLDPRQWAACSEPRCSFPMFEPDTHTEAHGLLKVHTYGGGTWTSEFAFLTGLPNRLFGPAGMYAPYNLAPRMRDSLPRQLKALGYRSVAIYPMPRDFVHAGAAYADYGFDAFHDSNDLGLVWGSSDAEVMQRFQDVRRDERARGDGPLFFMILTMRQHGPHLEPLDSLPAPWNEPQAALDEQLSRSLGNYLQRLQQSSDALGALRRDLFAEGRPTVLVHFGDHHPAFEGRERELGTSLAPELRPAAPEITYFRIDSNLPSAPRTATPPVLDLAFLGGLVLDVAGLPKNAYFEANTRLRERCGGRFLECPQPALLDSWRARTFGELRSFAQ